MSCLRLYGYIRDMQSTCIVCLLLNGAVIFFLCLRLCHDARYEASLQIRPDFTNQKKAVLITQLARVCIHIFVRSYLEDRKMRILNGLVLRRQCL